jgi:hypothetical protein
MMKTLRILNTESALDFYSSKKLADKLASTILGESVCMSWYDKAEDRESPAHVSECHVDCDIPGYIDYAASRGAELKVDVNNGSFVFCYRSIGEFA